MAIPTSPQVVSIGYEGRSVSELVDALRSQGVSVLVDVRLTPISRKPGLSKSALASTLRAAGIEYVHHRDLGNPKENRDGYRAGERTSLGFYQLVLESAAGQSALRHVSELLDEGVVALLCFERNHDECHRHQVADELSELRRDLKVTRA